MFKIDLTALEIDLTAFKRVRGVQLETMKPDQFGCSGMFQNEKSPCHCHQHHYHHHHQGMFIIANADNYMFCDKQIYQKCRIAQRR